jgi:non-heme chloroperoxidase
VPFFDAPDGTPLFYSDLGDGPPVVLVHSWSFHSSMWEYQVQALLAAGHRCVAMDRRGHGRSDHSHGGYDLDTLAGDVAALLTHLDLDAVTLVAHSMGTCEITRYLARHGCDRVARAAYLGAMTPYFAGAAGQEAVEATIAPSAPTARSGSAPAPTTTSRSRAPGCPRRSSTTGSRRS